MPGDLARGDEATEETETEEIDELDGEVDNIIRDSPFDNILGSPLSNVLTMSNAFAIWLFCGLARSAGVR
jgi:hypothetical protein